MINLDELLMYLSSGPCIAWIGAGPSAEMGSKSWNQLAHSVLEEARKTRKSGFQKLEDYCATKKYPQFLGEIERQYGYEFLLKQVRQLLKPDKEEGSLYKAITKLPFVAYFTTNFDGLLLKHLANGKKAWKTYQNDRESLSSVEVNVIPSVVKLHGDLQEGLEDSLVLTDDQYRLWYEQGEKEYFQTFIAAHLVTQRLVFIGYSLNDPELLQIQKRLAANLRRKIPAIAILPNTSDTELDTWAREYNISVITYAAKGEDNSELMHILNTAARFMSDAPRSSPIRADESRLAQKFYFWHRFEQKDETKTQVDALKSVILSTANEVGDKLFNCDMIAAALKDTIATDRDILLPNIEKCCTELVKEGWLTQAKTGFRLAPATKELLDKYSRQYDDLIGTFLGQVQLDLKAETGSIGSDVLERAARAVLEILTEIFKIRGVEIVNLAFAKAPVPLAGANDILSLIWNRANAVGDANLEFAVTNYVIDQLTRPQGIAEQVIEYLSKAFFAMQALRMNAGDEELINEFYRNQSFLVDENVLIPLIATGDLRYELCTKTVGAAGEKGIFMFTTESSAQEVLRHGDWASNLIDKYGEQSAEVFRASRGEGEYSSNAFLDGYIRESANGALPSNFSDYLKQCVGGDFTYAHIWSKLDSLGIKKLRTERIRDRSREVTRFHKEIQIFIASEAAERQGDKSLGRIERESDAYTVIYHWTDFCKDFQQEQRPQCSFLTFATALAGVASKGPRPLRRSILASPQALYELIIRYLGQSDKEMNIGSVLQSSYFRTVGQFIDKDKYATFFAPLISEFHRVFHEHYELYRKYIEEKLTKGVINEYDPLDTVDFVSSLEGKLQSVPRNIVEENEQIREELALANKRIALLEERERKRREYVKKQREASRKTGR
jgi:hypothetical protein